MKGAAAGEGRLPTEVVRRVFDRMRSGARSKDVNLTQREKEILVSFCRGMSYVAIAAARGVKVVTVRNAIYTIQVKLGVSSKQEIVVWAAQNGLLDDRPCGGGPLGKDRTDPSGLLRVSSHIWKTFPLPSVSAYYPVTTHECPCVPTRHTTGIERPWCVERLPSHISKMAVSTVSAGGPKWIVGGTIFEMWLGGL